MLRYFRNSCFIAEDNNKIVGFIMGFTSQLNKKKFFIWQIGVVSKLRKKEIGKKLLDKMEKTAEQMGCDTIELTVDPENIPSQRFFEKNMYYNASSHEGKIINIMGVETVKDYYKPGRHFIVFQKKLLSSEAHRKDVQVPY